MTDYGFDKEEFRRVTERQVLIQRYDGIRKSRLEEMHCSIMQQNT